MSTPGATCGDEHVQAFGGEPAGLAHAFEGFRPVQLDLAGVARRCFCGIDESGHLVLSRVFKTDGG